MTQLEMLTTLVDAVADIPENKHLRRAVFRANKRIEVLRARRAKMKRQLFQFFDADHQLINTSYRASDRPPGTVHVVRFKVWRYPKAERPDELNRCFPTAEGICDERGRLLNS